MGEILVADSETDGLLDEVSTVHMLQMGTLDGEDLSIYLADYVPTSVVDEARSKGLRADIRPLQEGADRLAASDQFYLHNYFGYDQHIMARFFGPSWATDESRRKARDTLIMARLGWSAERRHGLKDWGVRLGVHKGDFNGPWDTVTADMLLYAEQDIVVGRMLTRACIKRLEGQERALETEHAVAYWIDRQHHNGFHLDVKRAEGLYEDLLVRKRQLERELRVVFPSRWVPGPVKVAGATNSRYGYVKGSEFTPVEWVEFSPTKLQTAAQRFVERGWKPTKKTPTGAIQMDEEVVAQLALRFPEAKLIAEYLDLNKQSGAVGGKGGWLKLVKLDGRVHGRVNTIGAYTQRMAHSKPNMTTVPKSGPYRELWGPRRGWKLCGTDGEGIQARVVGHYLVHWDGGAFARRCESGDSSKGTDIHSANRDAVLPLFPKEMHPVGVAVGEPIPDLDGDPHKTKPTRAPSKNILYAKFFGAQPPRLGMTLVEGCLKAKVKPPRVPMRELGMAINRALEKSMTGLSRLQELVETTFERKGFLLGLDGRRLRPPNKRNAFVTLIQAGEAVIMKTALAIFCDEFMPADGLVWDVDWALCANVHDEVQIECRPEISEHIGARFSEAIRVAGERLDMKCAQQGKASIGNNWHETH